tara:strand:+ start:213 stop:620 length:408 start_codon:yes stop_codon:yes gene_type:complete
MKKVLITFAAVLTLMSCSKEEMIETQDEVNFSFQQAFTGEYLNSETFIDGELSDTCATTWSFTATSVRVKRLESCDESAQGQTSGFTFDDTTLYIGQVTSAGIVLIEYPYTEDANGNLTLTLLTGDFTITYKLTR